MVGSEGDGKDGDRLMARLGFVVLGVDYFLGDSCVKHDDEKGWNKEAWVAGMRVSAAPLVPPWLEAVRAQYSTCSALLFRSIADDVCIRVFRPAGDEVLHGRYVVCAPSDGDCTLSDLRIRQGTASARRT